MDDKTRNVIDLKKFSIIGPVHFKMPWPNRNY